MNDPNYFPNEGDEAVEIVICQGSLACSLQGSAAVTAQLDGCPFCRRETWHRGEMVGVQEPGRA